MPYKNGAVGKGSLARRKSSREPGTATALKTASAARIQMPAFERGGAPKYRQITEWILHSISIGAISQGERLPSVESAAKAFRVNPNTVHRAYRELESLGVIHTIQGSGSFVSTRIEANQFTMDRFRSGLDTLIADAKAIGLQRKDVSTMVRDSINRTFATQ